MMPASDPQNKSKFFCYLLCLQEPLPAGLWLSLAPSRWRVEVVASARMPPFAIITTLAQALNKHSLAENKPLIRIVECTEKRWCIPRSALIRNRNESTCPRSLLGSCARRLWRRYLHG